MNMNTYGSNSKTLRRPRTHWVSPCPTKLVITTATALRATDGWPGAVGRLIDYMPSELRVGVQRRR